MKLIARLAVVGMLLTGIGFARDSWDRRGRNDSSYNRSYDRDDYRYRDYRYRDNGYRNNTYRNNAYRYDSYRGNGYRNLPPGIQKKLRRGGSLPPGQAKRLNRDRYWRYR
jgi:hypothetical protein